MNLVSGIALRDACTINCQNSLVVFGTLFGQQKASYGDLTSSFTRPESIRIFSSAVLYGRVMMGVSPTKHSMREQGIPCIHAGGEAVLVRLLKGCKNKRNVIITGYAWAVLPSLFRADNFPGVIR